MGSAIAAISWRYAVNVRRSGGSSEWRSVITGVAKLKALDAFEANMRDANHLVRLAEGLTNVRARAMRTELQESVGKALKIKAHDRHQLDCLQSNHVFVTFLPGGELKRSDFDDQRPVLRQALVAACAATETYVADKVMERVGPLLSHAKATKRLRELQLNLACLMQIDMYQRRGWGIRRLVVEPYVREHASTAPSKMGLMLSLVGVDDWTRKVDSHRKVAKGDTEAFLDRVTRRRNKIAHEGDRAGRGRAALSIDEVKADLAGLESVVAAIEAVA